jgi:hypothetical protein
MTRLLVAILCAVIIWPAYMSISIILWLIGWPLCSWLVYRERFQQKFVPRFGRQLLEWSPRWAWLWANDEDGIDGLRGGDIAQARWMTRTAGMSCHQRILKWSCSQNPIGNLRFVPIFGFIIQPHRIRWVGNSYDPATDAALANRRCVLWHFVWHGVYTGLWLTVGSIQIRIGWKLKPADALGVTDYRAKGCGFAFQYRILAA